MLDWMGDYETVPRASGGDPILTAFLRVIEFCPRASGGDPPLEEARKWILACSPRKRG